MIQRGTKWQRTERRISGAENLVRSRLVGFQNSIVCAPVCHLASSTGARISIYHMQLHSKITDSMSSIEPRQNATPIDAFVTIMRYPANGKDIIVTFSLPFLPPDPIQRVPCSPTPQKALVDNVRDRKTGCYTLHIPPCPIICEISTFSHLTSWLGEPRWGM